MYLFDIKLLGDRIENRLHITGSQLSSIQKYSSEHFSSFQEFVIWQNIYVPCKNVIRGFWFRKRNQKVSQQKCRDSSLSKLILLSGFTIFVSLTTSFNIFFRLFFRFLSFSVVGIVVQFYMRRCHWPACHRMALVSPTPHTTTRVFNSKNILTESRIFIFY